MAKSFLTDLNLNTNVLLNAKIQAWGSDPTLAGNATKTPDNNAAGPKEGMISSYGGALYVYKGTNGSGGAWNIVGGSITIGGTTITSAISGGTTTIPLTGVFFDGAGITFKGATSGTSVLKANATAGTGTLTLPTATGTLVGTGDGGSVTGTMIASGTVTNSNLQNSTISGISLGQNLATLTFSAELGSGTYNGGGTLTVTPRAASTTQTGIVQLNDTPTSGDSAKAATSNSVYSVKQTADGALQRSGGTMTGPVSHGGYALTNLPDPVNAQDAATKNYVDNVSQGINVHDAVAGLITTNFAGTYVPGGGTATSVTASNNSTSLTVTNSGFNIAVGQTVTGTNIATGSVVTSTSAASGNITVTIDKPTTGALSSQTGVTFLGADGGTGVGATLTASAVGVLTSSDSSSAYSFVIGDRVLLNGQTTTTQNGIYVVTTAGTVSVAAVLTRALDYDNSNFGDISAGDLVFVKNGGTYGTTQWVQKTVGTATSGSGVSTKYCVKIGTDSADFAQFSGAGITASNATNVATTNKTDNVTYYPTFAAASTTGIQSLNVTGGISLNPSTNTVTATTFSGNATTATNLSTFSSTSSSPGASRTIAAQTTTASAGTGGSLTFNAGDSTNATGNTSTVGGDVTIKSGSANNSTNGTSGNVYIDSGAGGSANGNGAIVIGSTQIGHTGGNADTIYIGRGSGTVSISAGKIKFLSNTTYSSSNTDSVLRIDSANGVYSATATSGSPLIFPYINSTTITGITGSALALAHASVSSGTGNGITITGGGVTASTGAGGAVSLTGGAVTSTGTGAGGAASVVGGASSGGAGGAINITGGATTSTSANGGAVVIKGGDGGSGGTGGNVNLEVSGIGGTRGTINIGSTTAAAAAINIGTQASISINPTITIGGASGSSSATNSTIAIVGHGTSSTGSGSAGAITITGGSSTGASGTVTGGSVTINGGASTASTVGAVIINNQTTASTTNIATGTTTTGIKAINIGTNGTTGSTTTINIGTNGGNTPTTTINGAVKLPNVASGSDTRFVKISSTDGTLSYDSSTYLTSTGTVAKATNLVGGVLGSVPYQSTADTTLFITPNTTTAKQFLTQTGTGSAGAVPAWGALAYGDLPTTSLTAATTDGIARKKTGTLTANSSTTAFAINHGFGQWVTAQLFDTSGNLVEVDVSNASTGNGTTTFTFAVAPTTGTDYKYVIVG